MNPIAFYSPENTHNLTRELVLKNRKRINAFVDLYCEYGFYTPPEFQADPGEWTNILRKMQRAFHLAALCVEKSASVVSPRENEEMEEGFSLFGKYFLHLIDYDRGVPPKH